MNRQVMFFAIFFAVAFACVNPNHAFAVENISLEEDKTVDYGKGLTEYKYFEDIQALEPEMMEGVADLYLSEYPTENQELPEDFPGIHYEDAIKIYVNTGIHNMNTADEKTIKDWLRVSNYVWVLPLEYNGVNMRVTVARAKPLDEELVGAVTEEQIDMIEDRAGRWKITEVALGGPENYKEQIAKLEQQYDSVVFVGGIPGVQYPLALAFENGEAVSYIGIGYGQGVLEDSSATYSRTTKNPIYEYEDAMKQLKSYRPPLMPSGGGAGNSYMDTPFVCLIVGGMCCLGIIAYIIYRKRRFVRKSPR